MPELPEIETICRGIKNSKQILNQKINSIVIRNHKLRWPIPKNLPQILAGQKFEKIIRRGKYILLETKVGALILHLGMSGNLQIKPQNHIYAKHEHLNVIFASKLALCYTDPRRFGAILWTHKDPLQHPLLKNLGLEPLNQNFTAEYLFDCARNRKISIKQFIMDNKIVVGIGNIYASEALFAAKINPLQKANCITFKRYQLLVKKIKLILQQAIKHGGTSFSDYVNMRGKKGKFQNMLKIYGKRDQICINCKIKLNHVRIGQRSTVFCPACQK